MTRLHQAEVCSPWRQMVSAIILSLVLLHGGTAAYAEEPSLPPADVLSELPPGTGATWWYEVQQNIAAMEYEITPLSEAAPVSATAKQRASTATKQARGAKATAEPAAQSAPARGFSAPNRAQRFRTHFTDTGIYLAPRTEDEAPWELGLETRRMGRGQAEDSAAAKRTAGGPGRGGALRALGRAGNMTAEKSRIELERDGFREWMENTPRGLKQNFEIMTRPEGDGPLVVEYGVFGDLLPMVSADGQEVAFANEFGVATVFMEGLVVFDANSALLDARFDYDTDNATLSILVEDGEAAYPVTIDPLITRNKWQIDFSVSQFESVIQRSGSAGDVNGDGYSDLYITQPGYQDESGNTVGRIMVFYGSPSGLNSTPDWLSVGTVPAEGGRGLGWYGAVVLRATQSVSQPEGSYLDQYDDLALLVPSETTECEGGVPCPLNSVRIFRGGPNGLPSSDSVEEVVNIAQSGMVYENILSYDFDQDGQSEIVIAATDETGAEYLHLLKLYPEPLLTPLQVTLYDEIAPGGRAVPEGAGLGLSMAAPGDFNGNGYPDLIVGTPYSTETGTGQQRGRVYLVEGSATGLTGNARILMHGRFLGDGFPSQLEVGDFNRDGFPDVLASSEGLGSGSYTRILYRPAEALTVRQNEDYMGQGDYPMVMAESPDVFTGKKRRDLLVNAYHARSVGDTNGNGTDDFLYNYEQENTVASCYLETGRSTQDLTATGSLEDGGFYPPTSELSRTTGFIGFAEGAAGDVNGDGFNDYIVKTFMYQCPEVDPSCAIEDEEVFANRITIYYGGAGGNDVRADWQYPFADGSITFASIGDVNGDGIEDVYFTGVDGSGYVFFGRQSGLRTIPDWKVDLSETYEGNLGVSPGGVGDLNGDGFDDLVLTFQGFPQAEFTQVRSVLVYFGGPDGFALGGSRPTGSYENADWIWTSQMPESNLVLARIIGNVNPGDSTCPTCDDLAIVWKFRETSESENFDTELLVYYGSATGLPASSLLGGGSNVPVATPNDAPWRWQPTQFGGAAGGEIHDVIAAGDIDNNQSDDILVLTSLLPESPGFSNYAGLYGLLGGSNGLANISHSNPFNSGSFAWLVGSDNVEELITGAAAGSDINGDGYDDIVIVRSGKYPLGEGGASGSATIFYGRQDIKNGAAPSNVFDWEWIPVSNSYSSGVAKPTLGDFNGDSFADIVLASQEGVLAMFTGGPNGPAPAPTWTIDLSSAHFVIYPLLDSADVNGDGFSDLFVGGLYSYDANLFTTYLFYGPMQGPLGTPQWTVEGSSLGDLFGSSVAGIGDINGDGYDDILVGAPGFDLEFANRGAAYIYLGSSTGLSPTPLETGGILRGEQENQYFGQAVYRIGDLNGDGNLEFGVSSRLNSAGQASRLHLFTYNVVTSLPSPYQTTPVLTSNLLLHKGNVAVGDFDGDGDLDIALRFDFQFFGFYPGGVAVFQNTDGQLLSGRSIYEFSVLNSQSPSFFDNVGFALEIVAADLNGDGKDELCIASMDANLITNPVLHRKVSVVIGKEDFWNAVDIGETWPIFEEFVAPDFISSPQLRYLGDVNGDGFADIGYKKNSINDETIVFMGKKSLPNVLDRFILTVSQGRLGAPGDVNGDGYDDIAHTGDPHGLSIVYGGPVLSNDPNWRISRVIGEGSAPHIWEWAGLGDVNGDRLHDFALHTSGSLFEVPGRVAAFYGGPPLPSATVRRWAAEGDAPPLDFGRVVRAMLDYATGTNSVGEAAAPESITFFRSGPSQVPAVQTFELLPIRWFLDTGRQDFTADLVLQYTDFELGSIDEQELEVFWYTSEDDPIWSRAGSSQTRNEGRNSITVHEIQQGGYFVIGVLTNSAPVAGTVEMKTGVVGQAPPFDITPESLEIAWSGFTDDVGIVSYEVALVKAETDEDIQACFANPEVCFDWKNVGLVTEFTLNATDEGVDPSLVVDNKFVSGNYYYFVRAIDEEGARSPIRITPPPLVGVVRIVVTDRPTLGFGQAIPVPEGVAPCNVPSCLDPGRAPKEKGVVYIAAPLPGTNTPAGLFATQDTQRFLISQDINDLLWIDWNRDGVRQEASELYFVSDDPNVAAHTPMRIYHTDRPDGGRYPAPPVKFDNVDVVKTHFNDRVGFTEDLWVDPTNRELRARQTADVTISPNTGMVLLHFERLTPTGTEFIGTQIVDVRPYAPDFDPSMPAAPVFEIGDQLLPPASPYPLSVLSGYLAPPVVARGGTGASAGDHLYQHQVPGSDAFGNVYAIRKTTAPTFRDAEVFWMRTVEYSDDDFSIEGMARKRVSQLGIEWPYRMGRYNFEWPDPEALKVQRYIRDSFNQNAGVAVQLDGTLNPTVMPYLEDLLPFQIIDEPSTGRFSTARRPGTVNRGGWLLFRYRPGNEVLFQVVQCVDREAAGQTSELEELSKFVGDEIDGIGDEELISASALAKLRRTLLKDVNGQFIRDENGEFIEEPVLRIDKETPGYIHVRKGLSTLEDRYDWEIYDGENGVDPVNPLDVTGQIFGVNEGKLEVWWFQQDVAGTPWPANMQRYQVNWPTDSPAIKVDSGVGTGVLAVGTRLYYQNDAEKPGYNPNEEHALLLPPFGEGPGRTAAFALRDDFNRTSSSQPYVLLKRKKDGKWNYGSVRAVPDSRGIIKVTQGDLTYNVWAGDLLNPPYPLSRYETFPYVGRYPSYNGDDAFVPDPETTVIKGTYGVPLNDEGGYHWQDRNGRHWARANGDMKLRFYYRIPTGYGFFTPSTVEVTPEGRVRWLSNPATPVEPKEPADVTFRAAWPAVPALRHEDVLVKPKEAYKVKYTELGAVGDPPPDGLTVSPNVNTLPGIEGQVSVEIIYHESIENDEGSSAKLIDYKQARRIGLSEVPEGIATEVIQGKRYFVDLPPGLRERLFYDSNSRELAFQGIFVEPATAPASYPYYILPNIMTAEDRERIKDLPEPDNPEWEVLVDEFFAQTEYPLEVENSDPGYTGLALTTGNATATGYMTLLMQDAEEADPLPVSLEVIYVSDELQPGAIAIIEPLSPFDDKLTVRHENDYSGKPDDFYFDWYFAWDKTGTPPKKADGSDCLPGELCVNTDGTEVELWESVQFYKPGSIPASDGAAKGANELLIDARLGAFTLKDHWFVVRYKKGENGTYSDFTPAALGEGWIKRTVGRINPFTQRAEGGGIEGAEFRFTSFGEREINTIVSMISQAGPRYTGNIAMNARQNLDELGLIQIYETVLNRGRELSIDADLPSPSAFGGSETAANAQDPREDEEVNDALLLAAGRIADLYQLLGNEAYADAADPTIGFGTDDGQYGNEASSIFCFMNQVPTLLDEELALLRGRDDTLSPPVSTTPIYNRLLWNFTRDLNGGEVAYALNYNILDQEIGGQVDGTIDENDAKVLYPQGHGDAWGHFLYALKTYYRLLQSDNFTWIPRAEVINVGGSPITVDYLDERKFAKAAASKARTGAEVVNLTYRKAYVDDPASRWQGYDDDFVDTKRGERRWGVSDWAMRAGTGAYFDWLVVNAVLPAVDDGPDNEGVQKIDRTTVLAVGDIASAFETVQTQIDMADQGLSPLGLAADVVPFGIAPAGIDQGQTHFEQVYQRAVTATGNALTVFDYANNSTQRLRRQSDSIADFQRAIRERENDFKNRMIEVFGYPYADDIGATGTYPVNYDGPDIYNYMLTDPSEFTGAPAVPDQVFEITFNEVVINDRGEISTVDRPVRYFVDSDGFGIVKPANWTKSRRAPGEIQLAQKDLLQARGRFERALNDYGILIDQIERQAQLLEAQYNLASNEIAVLNRTLQRQQSLNSQILALRGLQSSLRRSANISNVIAGAVAEFLPTSVGFSIDATAPARGAIRLAGALISDVLSNAAEGASQMEFSRQQTKEDVSALSNIEVTTLRNEFALQQAVAQLTQLVRSEIGARYEIYNLVESLQQASGRYQASVARGLRLQDDLLRFRQETAGQVQSQRFRDMAFRVFRDDALQKYRAQFDLASRYVYMAAKAYDYETGLLGTENASGKRFLQDIVRARSIGIVQNGVPLTDDDNPTLADALARMYLNFDLVLRPQLGFNNPQTETNRFSVRSELFRIVPGSAGDEKWVERLAGHYVPNVLDIPDIRRYCQLPQPLKAVEPGIVIPFSTNVHQGLNYFGWPLGGGDSAYDSANFATKIRSVGVWFSNYNNLSGGLSNTPRVYLFPVGRDILRAPSLSAPAIRQFRVVDQLLPVPFPLSPSSMSSQSFIPAIDSQSGAFEAIRRYPSFRAYHDSGTLNPSELASDSRLVGRSVWNTQWLLVIPGWTLNANGEEGLERFIYGVDGPTGPGKGVTDIKFFFQTYAYSGAVLNKTTDTKEVAEEDSNN